MKPTVHVSFPRQLYARFRSLASALGWGVRGQCWKFLDLLLAHAEERPELFRNRMAKDASPYGSVTVKGNSPNSTSDVLTHKDVIPL